MRDINDFVPNNFESFSEITAEIVATSVIENLNGCTLVQLIVKKVTGECTLQDFPLPILLFDEEILSKNLKNIESRIYSKDTDDENNAYEDEGSESSDCFYEDIEIVEE